MNTLEIIKYLGKFPNFKGVYPRDMLPRLLEVNGGIVINTDKASEPGEHWVSIYRSEGSTIYFDSFGLPPLHDEIISFLESVSPIGWFYNTVTFQSVFQDTCGMYCIYFLTCMFRHKDFNKFRAVFNLKPELNDIFAKLIYKIQ